MTSSLDQQKAEMRADLRRQLAKLPGDHATRASVRICEHLGALQEVREARRLAGFLALPGEVHLTPLLERLHAEGCMIAVPTFDSGTNVYRFAPFQPGTRLVRGPHGVEEPEHATWLDEQTLQVILVPGLAFDLHGRRLGRGAGVYDRLLGHSEALRIGVAFDVQRVERVPAGVRDLPVDLLATPGGVHRCPSGAPPLSTT